METVLGILVSVLLAAGLLAALFEYRIRQPDAAGRAVTRTAMLPTLIERESTRIVA